MRLGVFEQCRKQSSLLDLHLHESWTNENNEKTLTEEGHGVAVS